MKILSIIIPSYNMEEYLRQCVESLIVDDLADAEVLIVNDGSKDSTLQIAREYESRFPHSIRVIDKPNGNYGSCINAGLNIATGKYIKVLDADDSFSKEQLGGYIKFLKSVDVDVVVSDYCFVDEAGVVIKDARFPQLPTTPFGFDSRILELPVNIFQMHAIAYRTENLKNLGYRQTEGISYTDQEWMFLPMVCARTVAYFPEILYRYLVGRAGQTINASKISHTKTLCIIISGLLKQYVALGSEFPSDNLKYLELRLITLIRTVFRTSLLYSRNEELESLSVSLDKEVEILALQLHASVAGDRIKSWLPIDYIGIWRRREHNPNTFALKLLRKGLSLYHRNS